MRYSSVLRRFFICIAGILLACFLGQQSVHSQIVRQKKKRNEYHGENMPKYDRKVIHFGINLGVVTSWLAIRPIRDLRDLYPDTIYKIESIPQTGFSMGIEMNLHMGNNFDFRFTPQLSLTSRLLQFYRPNGRVDKFSQEQTIIDVPLYFKFKTNRLANFRAYVIGGAKYSYDISHKIGAEDAADYPVKLKPHDVSAELGFGLDFYLQYFKFSLQTKVSWGVTNLLFQENNMYNNGLVGLYSRSVFISVLFE